jgi:alkylation response protein AidB-like acyl-CoA dehydrogenase
MTVEYVQMRVQFGQPIGAFQAVQMRCADLATIVEAARFLTHEMLWRIDQDDVDPAHIATVKAITAQMTPQVAQDCHLLHGGIGYMQEYDLHFFTRRGKDASLRWGSLRETSNRVADRAFAQTV